jgi:hypothetical protein
LEVGFKFLCFGVLLNHGSIEKPYKLQILFSFKSSSVGTLDLAFGRQLTHVFILELVQTKNLVPFLVLKLT